MKICLYLHTQNTQHMKAPRIKTIYIDKIPASERPKVGCSEDAFKIIYPHFDQDTISLNESVYILLLNRNKRAIGVEQLSGGGAASATMCPIQILRTALSTGAFGFVLAHNHPSGNLQPSRANIEVTNKIKKAGAEVGIHLLDHIILTPEQKYYSFIDNGDI
jgi:DNA repair protein RadC